MNGKLNKNAGLSLMPVAFLFLFDPSFALIDAIPDAIGYVLLCLSLINLADINPKMSDAFCAFRRAAILSVARIIFSIALHSYIEGKEQTMLSLVAIFAFATLEIIVLMPAYKSLFEGFLYLGTYHNGTYVHTSKREGSRNVSEKVYLITMIFVIVKNVFWVLPELSALMSNETYEFVHVLRWFALFVTVPLALFWLISMIRYLRGIRKDQGFVLSLCELYSEKTRNAESFFVARRIRIGVLLLSVAFVFAIDLTLDGINVIWDAWVYALAGASALILLKYTKKFIALIPVCILGLISSCLKDGAEQYFLSRFLPEHIIKNAEAYNTYNFMLLAYLFDAIVFCRALAIALIALKDVNRAYGSEHSSNKSKYVPGSVVLFAIGFLNAAANVFNAYALALRGKGFIFDSSGIFVGVLNIVFAIFAWYFISNIASAVRQSCRADLY